MNTEFPPDWAIEKAISLTSSSYETAAECKAYAAEPTRNKYAGNVIAFARYIAEQEEAPVDPDVLAVREIIAAWVNQDSSYRTEAMNGKLDCREDFARCLSAYRKHRNPGASS